MLELLDRAVKTSDPEVASWLYHAALESPAEVERPEPFIYSRWVIADVHRPERLRETVQAVLDNDLKTGEALIGSWPPYELPLAATFETGDLSFLVGAGISIDAPSCIPAVQPIITLVCRWLAAGDDDLARALITRCEPGHAFCPFDFLRFEAVLEAVSREIPKFLRLLQALETHGYPNLSHLFLVRAAAKGARILTTNFDTRLEMAAEWSGIAAPLFILSPRRVLPPPEDADRLLDQAEARLGTLNADHWNHASNINATRNKIRRMMATS